jgi:hypothetical protein
MRSPKGRRVATAAGALALVVIAIAGFLLQDDIRWWWRMRGVVQVVVADTKLPEPLSIKDPAALEQATRITKAFVRSLPPVPPGWQPSPVISSPDPRGEVFFVRSRGWPPKVDEIAIYLFLDRSGALLWEKGNFTCDRATWEAYVTDLLEAVASNRRIGAGEREASKAALLKIHGASKGEG